MRLGYIILHVADVNASVDFYTRAFGLAARFVLETGEYAEMETGATALAFATEAMATANGLPPRPEQVAPFGSEVALVTDDVAAAFATAIAEGGTPIAAPERKPWGQDVAYVRDPDGFLVELCSSMGS